MNEPRSKHDERFHEALSALESATGTAIVPGELRTWCHAVEDSLEPLQLAWRERLESDHLTFEQILRNAPGLSGRVDQLRKAEQTLRDELEHFASRVERLLEIDAERLDTSEEPLDKLESLREQLLAWIVGTRAHETELRTWLLEAIYRVAGEID